MRKLNIAKKFLIQEYITNHKPVNKIAEEFGYGETTIFRYLNEYKIKIRPTSEYTKVRMLNPKMNPSYIDGRTNKKYLCKGGCGKEVSANTYLYNGGCCQKCGALKGKDSPHYIDGRKSKKYFCIECKKKGIKTQIDYTTWFYGTKKCKSCEVKFRWKDLEYRDKVIKAQREGRNITPNVPEKILGKLLGKEYKFVGDGEVILGGFCPDFINCNGQKVIEMFGDYWHTKDQYAIDKDKRRLKVYKSLGYKTLVIWEHELSNLEKVKNRIIQFNNK
jgi:very-short-patch-repair endonuclease